MPYLNVTEVESALVALNTTYPSLCELISLPNTTYEGRTSHALRIGLGPADDRPAMLFIGGAHAREWGSCEICINFATDLLEAYDGGTGLTYGSKSFSASEVQTIVEERQVFIFPCVNPDGRHYSQTVEPMWRKNRNPADSGGDPSRIGVDINRNYDFLWDFPLFFSPSAYVVVSNDPSSPVYHGSAAESEPETQSVVWLLDTYPQIRWFIDIHSYSELLYHNWGDDENQITDATMNFLNPAYDGSRGLSGDAYKEYIRPGDLAAESCLVQRMCDALQAVRGISYSTGQAYDLYPTSGTGTDYPYSRHFANPTKTKTPGFLIEWGTQFQPPWSEMEDIILDVSAALLEFAVAAPCECSTIDVELLTPSINFNAVPEGETTFRAAVFSVVSCRDVTFEIIAGPTVTSGPTGTVIGTPLGTSDTAPGTPSGSTQARLWFSYTGTAAGDMAGGTVTIRCVETGEEWVIPITADTISRLTAVAVLALDQSNSMNFNSGLGTGITRGDVLKFSAPPFVDVIQDGNAMGIITFDHDAHDVMAVTPIDLASRIVANGHLAAYGPNPNGWTSIGEAVARAHDLLDLETGYDIKAMIVLTDGKENHDGYSRQYISDVAGLINERVYAIGLGTVENIQPSALQALCNGHEGYLLMTGVLDIDAYFRLAKYYQQILASVTNQDIVLDPEGWVKPGQEHRIPFRLNETDISSDIILLTPVRGAFNFLLETPAGDIIDPGVASANPAMSYMVGSESSFYRMSLPVAIGAGGAREGTWHAVLTIKDKYYKQYFSSLDDFPEEYRRALARGVHYSLTVHTYSNLRMRTSVSQNNYEPGATLTLRAVLTEYGMPVEGRATVHSELERPDTTTATLTLTEVEPGVFETSTPATMSGIYRFRVLAGGQTFRGRAFTREQTLTGAVWKGGDEPPLTSKDDPRKRDERLCRLLRCLIHEKVMGRYLAEKGINAEALEKCLKAFCEDPQPSLGDGIVRPRPEITQLLADPRVRIALSDLLKGIEHRESSK